LLVAVAVADMVAVAEPVAYYLPPVIRLILVLLTRLLWEVVEQVGRGMPRVVE
jgi:hypothetical protein